HGIAAAARGVVLELLLQIAPMEPGQGRRVPAVAAAVEPVAAEAGVGRAAAGAAQGDQFSGGLEGLAGGVARRRAARRQAREQDGEEEGAHAIGNTGLGRRFRGPGTLALPKGWLRWPGRGR